MPITISTDGISDEQKRTEKFKRAYREMNARLSSPEFSHVVCCHEAAHLLYFKKAGLLSYDCFPARLYYDSETDDYGGTFASIKPLDMKPLERDEDVEPWFHNLFRAHAAGGVVASIVMPGLEDYGDLDDKQRFLSTCEAYKKIHLSVNPEELWDKARAEVRQEMRDRPKTLAQLEKFAEEELRPKLGLAL